MSSLELHGAAHIAPFMPQRMQDIGTQMQRSASRFAVEAQNAAAAPFSAAATFKDPQCLSSPGNPMARRHGREGTLMERPVIGNWADSRHDWLASNGQLRDRRSRRPGPKSGLPVGSPLILLTSWRARDQSAHQNRGLWSRRGCLGLAVALLASFPIAGSSPCGRQVNPAVKAVQDISCGFGYCSHGTEPRPKRRPNSPLRRNKP